MGSKYGHDPVSGARWEIHEPAEGIPLVEVWADDYIPFEPPRTSWKWELRDEIRSRCQALEPSAGQVLHATFFGAMPPRSDVENLVLYNIGSLAVGGRNGIRFELGAVPPPAPSGETYSYCYRYALVPRCRTLASFDCGWIDLGPFGEEIKLAKVLLALARGFDDEKVKVFKPVIEPEIAFAVNLEIRTPRGKKYVLGNLVKPIFDGVICAFQAQTDTTDLTEIVDRLAEQLRTDPEKIRQYLVDQRRAVLGVVPRLVVLRGVGVQFNPSDHLCVAGELLAAESIDNRWAIKGRVIELSR